MRNRFLNGAVVALFSLACVPLHAAAQSRLGALLKDYKLGLTSISGIHEFSDGTILVADGSEKTLWLVDEKGARRVGREGAGPGEYRRVGALLQWPGDTAMMVDPGLMRLLPFSRTGQPGNTRQLQVDAGVDALRPAYGDDQGRMYDARMARRTNMRTDGRGQTLVDSQVIRRWNTTGRADTIAWFATERWVAAVDTRQGNQTLEVPLPFGRAESYAVAPSGAIAVVRSSPYRVEWYRAGGSIMGPDLPHDSIAITAAERDRYTTNLGARLNSLGSSVRLDGTLTWPRYKQPFEVPVLAGPGDRVWIPLIARRHGEAARYHVVRADGTLEATLQLPANTTIVKVTNTGIYVVRRDQDDLLWLAKYAHR